jgi:hypothetical protein
MTMREHDGPTSGRSASVESPSGMQPARIETTEFMVSYDQAQHCVFFSGAIRLRTAADYDDLRSLLRGAIMGAEHELRLDLRELDFLNSSGIGALAHFVVEARKADRASIAILGSMARSWQSRSLATLERIWSKVVLTIQE